jgi:hypothetical protein
MTIEESRKLKRATEQAILEALKNFTLVTGLTIQSVDVDMVQRAAAPNEPIKFTITATL